MKLDGLLNTFPKHIKMFLTAFVLVLSIGYFSGLLFVGQTDSAKPDGIEENYLGNEEIEDADIMKFKKGEREMLTILHTHILSISFIFFCMGGLVAMTNQSKKIKAFLMVEPFISIVLTFGGIYLLWKGITWFKYIVMVSGILMTLVFVVSALLVLRDLFRSSPVSNKN